MRAALPAAHWARSQARCPHGDINLLTILPAANEPWPAGERCRWTVATCLCDFGTLAINIGDMACRPASCHPSTCIRVLNPTGDSARRSRVSLPPLRTTMWCCLSANTAGSQARDACASSVWEVLNKSSASTPDAPPKLAEGAPCKWLRGLLCGRALSAGMLLSLKRHGGAWRCAG